MSKIATRIHWAGVMGLALGAALGLSLMAGTARAACDAGKSGYDLTPEEASAVYDCLKADLQAGYKKGPKYWVSKDTVADYPSWTAASAAPAAPGFHGERFLVTYVNDVGADEYMKYGADDVAMPVGSILAKESFRVNDSGKVSKGPLFIMEKAAEGASPKTGDWYYTMVSPNGVPQAVNVFVACNECHQAYEAQDYMAYPVEEARATR